MATENHNFAPFKPEDIDTAWHVLLGLWEVRDGALCHLYEGPTDKKSRLGDVKSARNPGHVHLRTNPAHLP